MSGGAAGCELRSETEPLERGRDRGASGGAAQSVRVVAAQPVGDRLPVQPGPLGGGIDQVCPAVAAAMRRGAAEPLASCRGEALRDLVWASDRAEMEGRACLRGLLRRARLRRPVGASPARERGGTLARLERQEVRQQVGPRPALGAALPRPRVVLGRVPSDVVGQVESGGAAEHAAAALNERPAALALARRPVASLH